MNLEHSSNTCVFDVLLEEAMKKYCRVYTTDCKYIVKANHKDVKEYLEDSVDMVFTEPP